MKQAPRQHHSCSDSDALSAHVKQACGVLLQAGVGERATRQACLTCEAIAEKQRAFTAASLTHELRGRGVSRSTVYRILARLHDLRLIARVRVGGSRGYVVCDESQHHHHFTCSCCGRVYPILSAKLESELERIADAHHFVARTHWLEVGGVCAGCGYLS